MFSVIIQRVWIFVSIATYVYIDFTRRKNGVRRNSIRIPIPNIKSLCAQSDDCIEWTLYYKQWKEWSGNGVCAKRNGWEYHATWMCAEIRVDGGIFGANEFNRVRGSRSIIACGNLIQTDHISKFGTFEFFREVTAARSRTLRPVMCISLGSDRRCNYISCSVDGGGCFAAEKEYKL